MYYHNITSVKQNIQTRSNLATGNLIICNNVQRVHLSHTISSVYSRFLCH